MTVIKLLLFHIIKFQAVCDMAVVNWDNPSSRVTRGTSVTGTHVCGEESVRAESKEPTQKVKLI